jgi:23S rRNA (guanosine2251-2'-O)-methyltransferase
MQQGRDDRRAGEIAELAQRHSVALEQCAAGELDALTHGAAHQGAVACVEPAAPLSEDELLVRLEGRGNAALVLVLDGVQDPHNLGACLRTADAAGADAVVAPRDRAASLTPVVRKVAAGAAETTPFAQVTNLARFLRSLKEQELWVIGADSEATQLHSEADLTGGLALVLGAEGTGMRRLTREQCDLVVRLPMRGAVPSLNVSVAAGVLLYEALRQRARLAPSA